MVWVRIALPLWVLWVLASALVRFSGAVVVVKYAGVASAVCCQSHGLFFILFCIRSSKSEGFSALVVSSGSPCAVFSLAWQLPCLSVGLLAMGFS